MTEKTPKPTQQEVRDAIAYFRATTNRHDLTDILTAALDGGDEPDKSALVPPSKLKK